MSESANTEQQQETVPSTNEHQSQVLPGMEDCVANGGADLQSVPLHQQPVEPEPVEPEAKQANLSTLEKLKQNVDQLGLYGLVFLPASPGGFPVERFQHLEKYVADDAIICVELPRGNDSINEISKYLGGRSSFFEFVINRPDASRSSSNSKRTSSTKKSSANGSGSQQAQGDPELAAVVASGSSEQQQDASGSSVSGTTVNTQCVVMSEIPDDENVSMTDATSSSLSPSTPTTEYHKYTKSQESLDYRRSGRVTSLGVISSTVVHVFAQTSAQVERRILNSHNLNRIDVQNQRDAMVTVLNTLALTYDARNRIVLGRSGPCDNQWVALQCVKSQVILDSTNEDEFELFLNNKCVFYNRILRGPRSPKSGFAFITQQLEKLTSPNATRKFVENIWDYLRPNYKLRTLTIKEVPSPDASTCTTKPEDVVQTGESVDSTASATADTKHTDNVGVVPDESQPQQQATTDVPVDAKATKKRAKRTKPKQYVVDKYASHVNSFFVDDASFARFMTIPEVVAEVATPEFQSDLAKATKTKSEVKLLKDRFPDVGLRSYYEIDAVSYVEFLRNVTRKKSLANSASDGIVKSVNLSSKRSSSRKAAAAAALATMEIDATIAEGTTEPLGDVAASLTKKAKHRPKKDDVSSLLKPKSRSTSSGINRPFEITPRLSEFISNTCPEYASKIYPPFEQDKFHYPRTLIVKLFSFYIKKYELAQGKDRRKIVVTPELQSLFDIDDKFHLTRFNINKLLNSEFVSPPHPVGDTTTTTNGDSIVDCAPGPFDPTVVTETGSSKSSKKRSTRSIMLPRMIPRKTNLRGSASASVPDLPVKTHSRKRKQATVVVESENTPESTTSATNTPVGSESESLDKKMAPPKKRRGKSSSSKTAKKTKESTDGLVVEPIVDDDNDHVHSVDEKEATTTYTEQVTA